MALEQKLVLLVDDNDTDILLMQHAFEKAGTLLPPIVVKDGREAVDYLQGEGPYADRAKYPVPSVMLLDLKMPRMDGFEVLQWVRNSSHHRHLFVVVQSASGRDEDVKRAYDLCANGFLVKPSTLEELVSMVKAFFGWITINRISKVEDHVNVV